MTGILLNSGAIILGAIMGFLGKKIIPRRVEQGLTPVFSLIALGLGITMVIKVRTFPVVVLSIIFGNIIGDLLQLENHVQTGSGLIQRQVEKIIPHKNALHPDEFSRQFASLIVLFSFSTLGIMGALSAGLTGNYQLLVIKAILDFFTAIVFAVSLGISVSLIALFQFSIQGIMFLLAQIIMPFMDDLVNADFSATGGIIMLGLALRMAKIKHFPVLNMIPALILVFPISYLWRAFF